ncbi:MAG TPA: peptidase M28 [Gammaproteobacteria bacterium]|nr:peptidase M28 [Gammaproteobacteria bacterium]
MDRAIFELCHPSRRPGNQHLARWSHTMYRSILSTLLIAALGLGCEAQLPTSQQGTFQPNEPLQRAASQITEQGINQDIEVLSSDAFRGRAPGTAGDGMTQRYLIDRMQAIGLAPGGPDDQWRQPFSLIALNAAQPANWTFSGPTEQLELEQGNDFIVSSGVQAQRVTLDDAPLLFVGYGIQAQEYDWDDYKGVDVQGKVLVMMNNDPDWSDDLFAGEARLYYGRWTYKYEIAEKLGAAGVIILHTTPSAGYPWQVVQTSWTGPQFELPKQGDGQLRVKGWVTEDSAEKLFQLAGLSLTEARTKARSASFQPIELPVTTSLDMNVAMIQQQSANVLGLVPGGDLASEVVIYTAHHDHLGASIDRNTNDIQIYNGAMDNASGVASVLAIAQAFVALPEPPRRSILFAFVGAEEQGLLGSAFYAQNPTIAPGHIAAAVNMDGVQINGRSRDINFVGYGRSTVDEVADRVAAFQGRIVKGDQNPSAGLFYRSDHFSLAKIGVPALNFRGGHDLLEGGLERGKRLSEEYVQQHYHQPSDVLGEHWRFDGLVEDAQFGFYSGWLLAEQSALPEWQPGDEFLAARVGALATADGPMDPKP